MFLPVASNDNDDLLALSSPFLSLTLVREMKNYMLYENSVSGVLLYSRKERRFFQEILDSERYILMRYFSTNVKEENILFLKRYIIDNYLYPKIKRGRRSKKN
ncbi:MAG: hypothetical protein R3D71_05375 [Rickettsiales bacterium]